MLRSARYGTSDPERAKMFYDAIAGLLGASYVPLAPDLLGYRGSDGAMLIIGRPLQGETSVGNGSQMNLAAPNRAAVDAVYAKVLELGGKSEGEPRVRGPDPNGHYGAYFRDLDGNKLSVLYVGPP